MVKLLRVGHSKFLWTFCTTFSNLKRKLVLIGIELVLGDNTKVVGMSVSFLMSLVWRQKDLWNLSYGQITTRRSQ